MRVSDIMTRTVYTVSPDAPLREVATLICLHHISGVPVVDAAGQLVGMVSERDVLQALYPTYTELIDDPLRSRDFVEMESRYDDLSRRKVAELMVRHVVMAKPEMPLLEAASQMLRHCIRRLPVVEAGRLVGIVSLGDMHQALFAQYLGRK
ncbi:MAG: CBS domain-containing protein [Chloroflexi bacterium]|nr:CBS domain-containing protein [Chloroflexota bacterium]